MKCKKTTGIATTNRLAEKNIRISASIIPQGGQNE